jgi:hypothetical protein
VALLAAAAITATSVVGCTAGSMTPRAIAPTAMSVSMPDVRATAVDVITVNGRLVIRQDPTAKDTTITAEARLTSTERADQFTVEASMQPDGTLRIRPVWPGGEREMNEQCNITVVAPQLTSVDARTSNGSVSVSGGAGKTIVRTSNGSVALEDRTGSVYVRTSNSGIAVSGGAGPLDLGSSNGTITIRGTGPGVDHQAYDWRASTSNGSIRLDLPQPAGRVRASTSNGKASVVRRDAGGAQTTLASSSSIDYSPGVGGGEILLSTSNGSVVVLTP